MSLPSLPKSAIVIAAEAADWRAAVTLAGEALAESGAARPAYSAEMIRMIEEHGPYVVIALSAIGLYFLVAGLLPRLTSGVSR